MRFFQPIASVNPSHVFLHVPPLVSILIPAYNAGRWITETLDSALAQTYAHCEIIVIDDGSTDDTLANARCYEGRNLRVVTQPNAGASAARNHGLHLARGAFIQFLDADDLLAPDKIERQMTCFLEDTSLQLCSGEWARFVTQPSDAQFVENSNHRDLTGVEFLQLFYEKFSMMQPAAWLARRSLLDTAGPWDETLSLNDDGEYFARVMLGAPLIHFCAGARVYYRSAIKGSLSARTDGPAMNSLYRATESITRELLARDRSDRSLAAVAYAWKWTAFELYPADPGLSKKAWSHSLELGGSTRPFPAGPRFHSLARMIGWRLAKRIRSC
jgi:glycosyltransferase involved in cell wall biosynthesis